jgi:putative two-component system response regulator
MDELSSGLRRIFCDHRDDFSRRVATVEAAVEAIAAGALADPLRGAAEDDAHKLAGALGTFGLLHGSDLARELELRLGPGQPAIAGDVPHLAACVKALRDDLDDEYARLGGGISARPPGSPLVDVSYLPDPSDLVAEERRELRRAICDTGLAGTEQADLLATRILVVDDDAAVREGLVTMLAEAGYDAHGVGSAREARKALEDEEIPLLLSDVSMPGESGLDLIRFALCEHPGTATLLISALEDPQIAQVGMDFGAYGYLSKPVRRSAVLIGVMSALRRRDVEARERATRVHLEDILRLRTSALTEALERVEAAAGRGRVLQAETIHRWAQSAEYRDPGIGRHLKRVGHYSALLGQKFGLHSESLELASVLHDIGKIAISDAILLKPGPLTPDERLVIETHATIGHEMLRGSCSGLLDLAALIARTHHERFDGGGYPAGLSGASIPLEGRIVAVADVFDALTSDRAYRPAWSVDTTIAWMTRERGRHFDPDVLDTFCASMDEVLSVQSLLS